MLLDPLLTYCPNCGTLARVRQTQTEPPHLMLSRFAVGLAGGFSFVGIFANFLEVGLAMTWFHENGLFSIYSRTGGNWLAYVIIILFVASLLMSFGGALYGYEASHRRWNAKRLKSVLFSARLLIFLGSIHLLLGFAFQRVQLQLSEHWLEAASMISPLLWAIGTFMILLSLPSLVIATRWLKREEAEATYVIR